MGDWTKPTYHTNVLKFSLISQVLSGLQQSFTPMSQWKKHMKYRAKSKHMETNKKTLLSVKQKYVYKSTNSNYWFPETNHHHPKNSCHIVIQNPPEFSRKKPRLGGGFPESFGKNMLFNAFSCYPNFTCETANKKWLETCNTTYFQTESWAYYNPPICNAPKKNKKHQPFKN